MRIYFTSRDNIGSKLIRWATDGDVSHVAIGIGASVYHSTEHGFLQQHFVDFAQNFNIVRALEFDIPEEQFALAFTAAIPGDVRYDFEAFLYFAYRAFRKKFLGDPLPSKNAWDGRGLLCTEMVGVADQVFEVLGYGSLVDDKIDLAITSPIELYYLLENKSSKRVL